MAQGNSDRIILFGGSFDPPHSGHLLVARNALEQLGAARLIFLVAKQNPLKEETPSEQESRLKQVEEMIGGEKNFAAVADKNIYAIETIKDFIKTNRIIWLMGADAWQDFHNWHEWEAIMRLVPLAIYPRDNIDIISTKAAKEYADCQQSQPQNITAPAWVALTGATSTLSSTALRDKR